MPPPLDHPSLNLILFDGPFIVYKLRTTEQVPDNVVNILTRRIGRREEFISVTRTSEEISIVCNAADVPQIGSPRWRCIKIKGPMNFGLTGVMCDFASPLKYAGISIFALSTWNTDYILVPESKADDAVEVLKEDGWKFENKDSKELQNPDE